MVLLLHLGPPSDSDVILGLAVFARKGRSAFPLYLSVVTVFKNEVSYIGEWIEYHLRVGVDKFFLFDNDSTDHPKRVLCQYIEDGIVNYTHWPGKAQQIPVYTFCLQHLRRVTFWIAFIDVDEFIVPVSRESIPQILRFFEKSGGLIMYWVVFGSGGEKKWKPGLVMERFTDHLELSHLWSHIVKSIVNPRVARSMSVHEARYQGTSSRDCHGKLLRGWVNWVNRTAVHDCIRVNHYWTKSSEEWAMKVARGRASVVEKRRSTEAWDFLRSFGNTDTTILRYADRVKQSLAERARLNYERCQFDHSPEERRDEHGL
jgi:hypothetical protein